MDSEELLAQLADIHLPEPISYWPPAPGWWVLLVLLVIAAVWITRRVVAAKTQQRIKATALTEFDNAYQRYNDSTDSDENARKLRYVNEANSVLKRVALYHFPETPVAGLGGTRWITFLREAGDSSELDEATANALSSGRFQTQVEVDVETLHDFGKQWIASLYNRPSTGDKNLKAIASSTSNIAAGGAS